MAEELPHNRIYWIDTAKALGIYLVVLGHLSIPEPLYHAIYSFHMPLFFILAGMTFNSNRPCAIFFKKKLKGLLLPFYIFSVFLIGFWYFLGRHYGVDATVATPTLPNVFAKTFLGMRVQGFPNPLWFLACLFVAESAFYFMLKQKSKVFLFIQVTVALAGGLAYEYLGNEQWPSLPLNLEHALYYLAFVALGYFFLQPSLLQKRCQKVPSQILLIAICIFIFLGTNWFLFQIQSTWYKSSIAVIPAIAGSLATILLCRLIPSLKALNFIGKNTLIILALHIPMLSVLKGFLLWGLHIDLSILNNSIASNTVLAALCILALTPVIFFINRFMPWAVGKSKN